MYPLYEQSQAWQDLLHKSNSYYEHDQSTRALLCLTIDPSAEGFSYVQKADCESCPSHSDVRFLHIKAVDVIDAIYKVSPDQAWVEIGPEIGASPAPGFGTRIGLDEISGLPVIALQNSRVVLFVKASKNNRIATYPVPTIRYACVNHEIRSDLVKKPQQWHGARLANGHLYPAAYP